MIFLGLLLPHISQSQTEVFEFLKGGKEDASKLFEAYFQPYGTSLGSSLNAGWFNTAKTHRLGGFDITITGSATLVPSSGQKFDLRAIDFSQLSLIDTSKYWSPTISGSDSPGPFLGWRVAIPGTGTDTLISLFQAPKGTGFKAFGLPMVKAGVGLPFGFELMGRYMPPLKIGNDLTLGMWGVGLKYNILQLFPFVDKVPFLNFSAMGAYTQLNSTADILFPVYGDPDVLPNASFDNQKLKIASSGLTGNLLLSVDVPVITVYGGVGFSSSETSVKALGDYPITILDTDQNSSTFGKKIVQIEKDPISLDLQSHDGMRYIGGLKFKLALLTIHFDYTYAEYSVFSTGIGISFR